MYIIKIFGPWNGFIVPKILQWLITSSSDRKNRFFAQQINLTVQRMNTTSRDFWDHSSRVRLVHFVQYSLYNVMYVQYTVKNLCVIRQSSFTSKNSRSSRYYFVLAMKISCDIDAFKSVVRTFLVGVQTLPWANSTHDKWYYLDRTIVMLIPD